MPDREKVIKDLEEVRRFIECENLPAHTLKAKLVIDDAIALLKALDVMPEELERLRKCRHECKIDCLLEHYESIKAERDALLKAQEPRVMMLEEAQGADYCWYESRTANICILCDATMYPNLNGKPKTELQTMGTALRGWQYDYAYGKDWRCWDKEPTNAQREAIPWND